VEIVNLVHDEVDLIVSVWCGWPHMLVVTWQIRDRDDLAQLPIPSDPERVWRIIQLINATPIEDEPWRKLMHAAVSGAVEELVVVNERTMLPVVLRAAKESAVSACRIHRGADTV
jgi:hypothetical protein